MVLRIDGMPSRDIHQTFQAMGGKFDQHTYFLRILGGLPFLFGVLAE